MKHHHGKHGGNSYNILIICNIFLFLLAQTNAFYTPLALNRKQHPFVSTPKTTALSSSTNNADTLEKAPSILSDVSTGTSMILQNSLFYSSKKTSQETVEAILSLCDSIDSAKESDIILGSMRYSRYLLLNALLQRDYEAYKETATFLQSRLSREDLPNVQDISFPNMTIPATEEDLVADCTLPNATFNDNLLDQILLKTFRNLVKKNSDGVAVSSQPGILGLLEQGRTFMLSGASEERQHAMVRDTLRDLMGPIVPVYRLFMAGIVPDRVANALNLKNPEDEKEVQIGPLFYAPYLTTIVTPLFFKFLVGPSSPNSRKDGRPGGLLVEKCKFLQESNCKGLCLHQCKLPAQEFFEKDLGVRLTVSPNFETQECQWSFGETPLPPDQDPSFPKGCLVGCQSRTMVLGDGSSAGVVQSNCG